MPEETNVEAPSEAEVTETVDTEPTTVETPVEAEGEVKEPVDED